ncbi:MAG: hypothetical protein QW076_06205, partial [Candidatus Anstonellales archaeon]
GKGEIIFFIYNPLPNTLNKNKNKNKHKKTTQNKKTKNKKSKKPHINSPINFKLPFISSFNY